MAFFIVSGWTWDRSTAMPNLFISLTTSTPNALSPPAVACSFHLEFSSKAASAQPGPPHWRQREVAAAEPIVHPEGSQ